MDDSTSCALCAKRLRKVNGVWVRYNYTIEPTGIHCLGGRPVKTKRRYATRTFGCKSCYESLAPPRTPTPVSHIVAYAKFRDFVAETHHSHHFYCCFLVEVGGSRISPVSFSLARLSARAGFRHRCWMSASLRSLNSRIRMW
jgi:hypothetical protein